MPPPSLPVNLITTTMPANQVVTTMPADPREPEGRKLAHIGRTTVDICVGKEDYREFFSVHDTLLASRSEFFTRAMNGRWKESKERLINLPEDSPAVFSLYMHHLYTSKLATAPNEGTPDSGSEHYTLAQLYVFAEKIQDSKCKNDIVDAMVAHTFEGPRLRWPGTRTINTIYRGTAGPCTARRFLVDIHAVERGSAWCANHHREEYPAEFIWDVITRMSERKPPSHSRIVLSYTGSRYHEVIGDEPDQGEKLDDGSLLGLSDDGDTSS
ncbi:uncharacterized protein BDZ99DRAFT_453580 [Mytilinidion resinicola]|uniref:BTB domain-containing protein n=1 Tax=Mytilinidion resinicola TaxID=574789 RepID=A0A6A6Y3A9_9PEZI|nr:uncharacterized protein BDZ99DRAFT_453580 [Mytilinidion resinicola]KAF2803316.1 hypothetical protein BDZ99DRAFT_453580 [Mytilinidion resinicola]